MRILVIAAHPDDAELGCGGTIAKHVAAGKKVGILDLTKGELGTRGNAKIRLKEVETATKIIKAHVRENLGFEDGFFQNDKEHQLELIKVIRKYQPTVILTNAKHDRHPDHAKVRRDWVLKRMLDTGQIENAEFKRAVNEPLPGNA